MIILEYLSASLKNVCNPSVESYRQSFTEHKPRPRGDYFNRPTMSDTNLQIFYPEGVEMFNQNLILLPNRY